MFWGWSCPALSRHPKRTLSHPVPVDHLGLNNFGSHLEDANEHGIKCWSPMVTHPSWCSLVYNNRNKQGSPPPSWTQTRRSDQSVTNYFAGVLASRHQGPRGLSSRSSGHLGRSKVQSPPLHSQHKAKETLERGVRTYPGAGLAWPRQDEPSLAQGRHSQATFEQTLPSQQPRAPHCAARALLSARQSGRDLPSSVFFSLRMHGATRSASGLVRRGADSFQRLPWATQTASSFLELNSCPHLRVFSRPSRDAESFCSPHVLGLMLLSRGNGYRPALGRTERAANTRGKTTRGLTLVSCSNQQKNEEKEKETGCVSLPLYDVYGIKEQREQKSSWAQDKRDEGTAGSLLWHSHQPQSTTCYLRAKNITMINGEGGGKTK